MSYKTKGVNMKIIPYIDLQTRKTSDIATSLEVSTEELKEFLSKIVITKNESGLNIAVFNKLKRKKV